MIGPNILCTIQKSFIVDRATPYTITLSRTVSVYKASAQPVMKTTREVTRSPSGGATDCEAGPAVVHGQRLQGLHAYDRGPGELKRGREFCS